MTNEEYKIIIGYESRDVGSRPLLLKEILARAPYRKTGFRKLKKNQLVEIHRQTCLEAERGEPMYWTDENGEKMYV